MQKLFKEEVINMNEKYSISQEASHETATRHLLCCIANELAELNAQLRAGVLVKK